MTTFTRAGTELASGTWAPHILSSQLRCADVVCTRCLTVVTLSADAIDATGVVEMHCTGCPFEGVVQLAGWNGPAYDPQENARILAESVVPNAGEQAAPDGAPTG